MNCEIGVFINPLAKQAIKERAIVNSNATSYAYCTDINSISSVKKLSPRLIVVGGEGSIRTILQKEYDSQQFRVTGIFDGGTNNLFYDHLRKNGNYCSWSDFVCHEIEELNFFHCRPGIYGNNIFNINLGIGLFEQSQGIVNENLRPFIQGKLRPRLAQVISISTILRHHERETPCLEVFSTLPKIGVGVAFPELNPESNIIAQGLIKGDSKLLAVRNIILTFLHWQLKLTPPSSIFRVRYSQTFLAEAKLDSVYLDGDTFRKKKSGNGFVTRIHEAIPVIAIIN